MTVIFKNEEKITSIKAMLFKTDGNLILHLSDDTTQIVIPSEIMIIY